MTEDTRLRIQRPTEPVEPPPYRGRLMKAYHVAEQLYSGERSPKWVLRNVPGKLNLGHRTKMWWEFEVIEWINSTKEGAA